MRSRLQYTLLPRAFARSFKPWLVACSLSLAISDFASAQAGCEFRNTPFADIVFPTLDPSFASTVSATTHVRVRCSDPISFTWTFSDASGSNPPRMMHATLNAFITYSAAASPVNIPNASNQFWQVTATIVGSAYENAPAGSYSGRLVVTISP